MLNNFLNRFRFPSKGVQNVSICWFLFIRVCERENCRAKNQGKHHNSRVIKISLTQLCIFFLINKVFNTNQGPCFLIKRLSTYTVQNVIFSVSKMKASLFLASNLFLIVISFAPGYSVALLFSCNSSFLDLHVQNKPNKHTKKGQQKVDSFHCITDVKQSRWTC